jgi:hypothetical protein
MLAFVRLARPHMQNKRTFLDRAWRANPASHCKLFVDLFTTGIHQHYTWHVPNRQEWRTNEKDVVRSLYMMMRLRFHFDCTEECRWPSLLVYTDLAVDETVRAVWDNDMTRPSWPAPLLLVPYLRVVLRRPMLGKPFLSDAEDVEPTRVAVRLTHWRLGHQ